MLFTLGPRRTVTYYCLYPLPKQSGPQLNGHAGIRFLPQSEGFPVNHSKTEGRREQMWSGRLLQEERREVVRVDERWMQRLLGSFSASRT